MNRMMPPPLVGDAVSSLLHKANLRDEQTSSLARFGVGATLLVLVILIHLDPLPANSNVAVQLYYARITLIVITLSGLCGYLLIRLGYWQPWIAYMTATVDVLAVLFNVWSSVTHDDLGRYFIFAYPVAMALPLVLILSSLRFRPWLQVYVTALLGLGLIAVFYITRPVPTLERQQLVGVLAFVFGPPPNGVRFTALMLGGFVLIWMTYRVRTLLNEAMQESSRRALLSRFVSGDVNRLLDRHPLEQLRRGSRLTMAVLFVDVRGSTHIGASMDPTEFAALINRFRLIVGAEAARHGGGVDKFIGDGALILFGTETGDGTFATRAVACAKGLIDNLSAAGIPAGVGLHVGEVFAGLIGEDDRMELTVIGDTVNLAARIEQATKTYDVPLLVTAATLQAAKADMSQWHLVDRAIMRGRDEPTELYGPASSIA
jgi:adenylate cyclase